MAPKMNYTKEMRDRNKAFMKAFRDEGHLVGVHIVGARVRDMVTDDFGRSMPWEYDINKDGKYAGNEILMTSSWTNL